MEKPTRTYLHSEVDIPDPRQTYLGRDAFFSLLRAFERSGKSTKPFVWGPSVKDVRSLHLDRSRTLLTGSAGSHIPSSDVWLHLRGEKRRENVARGLFRVVRNWLEQSNTQNDQPEVYDAHNYLAGYPIDLVSMFSKLPGRNFYRAVPPSLSSGYLALMAQIREQGTETQYSLGADLLHVVNQGYAISAHEVVTVPDLADWEDENFNIRSAFKPKET